MSKLSKNLPSHPVVHFFLIFAIFASLTILAISLALLHANLFDYRFGLTAFGIVALGLAAGLAAGGKSIKASGQQSSATWVAVASVMAAILIGQLTTISFGSIPTYLLVAVFSATPFFFGAIGIVSLHTDGNPEFCRSRYWAALIGAIVGICITRWLTDTVGPLQLAWWAAICISLLALTINWHLKTVMISAMSLIILGLLGFHMAWDFSTPPRWIDDAKSFTKQYYVAAVEKPTRLATYWDTFTRTDVATNTADVEDSIWIFTNGMLIGSRPAKQPGADSTEQLGKKFPLIALPLAAAEPRKILVINSGVDLVARLAANAGVSRIRDFESNPSMKHIMQERTGNDSRLSGQPGTTIEYGEARAQLRHDRTLYDQIYLTLPQKQNSGWMEPEPAENYLYTEEAFNEYWSHIKPGGMLVVLSRDELLYMRALLTAWKILKEDKVYGSDFLVHRAWGYRAVTDGTPSNPYRYMYMLIKGHVPKDLAARINGLADGMTVIGLFGPDITPPTGTFNIYLQPYYILYHPLGLKIADKALNDYATRNLQALADMTPVTDLRPFFFEIERDMPSFLKWLFAVCLALLAYVFLIPLPSERRLDSPGAAVRPPLPVHLGYFLIIGFAAMPVLTALFYQSILWTGDSGRSLTGALAGTAIGAVTGMMVLHRKEHRALERLWLWVTMATVVITTSLSWLIPLIDLSTWPTVLQTIAVGGLALPVAAVTVILLIPGREFLARNLPSLIPWSWLTFGAAIVVGIISALWIAQYWGFRLLCLTSASCYLSILGIGLWLHRSELEAIKQAAPD